MSNNNNKRIQRDYNYQKVGRTTAEGEVKTGNAIGDCEVLTKVWERVGREREKEEEEEKIKSCGRGGQIAQCHTVF